MKFVHQDCLLQCEVRDAGNLLTRAGFALPGVDVDEYTVRYKSGPTRITRTTDCSLIAFPPLVLVTGSAHREGALVAGDERFAFHDHKKKTFQLCLRKSRRHRMLEANAPFDGLNLVSIRLMFFYEIHCFLEFYFIFSVFL